MKQAVIAPSMLYLLYPLDGNVEGYPKEDFEKDLVDEVGIVLGCSNSTDLLDRSARRTFVVVSKQAPSACQSTLPRVCRLSLERTERCSINISRITGRLAAKNDPRNPWTGRQLLKTFIDLNNKLADWTRKYRVTSDLTHG
jgi:hypothetical protein